MAARLKKRFGALVREKRKAKRLHTCDQVQTGESTAEAPGHESAKRNRKTAKIQLAYRILLSGKFSTAMIVGPA
jgi:hypothetical protein